jgi:hypothetical protein
MTSFSGAPKFDQLIEPADYVQWLPVAGAWTDQVINEMIAHQARGIECQFAVSITF